MNPRYEKLKALLRELFQLDQPDLDFGLYRIMHAKADEINRFLDNDLLPQVTSVLGEYKSADRTELAKELEELEASIRRAGMDPEQSPKVKELREKYESQSVDLEALENDVYDHLYGFFRRYYHEGDFIAKRVYKPGVYAIPYEGEEVKLHWANRDQYYIKTSEYLRDYAFRLRPDAEDPSLRSGDVRVHFKLVDAAEGAHNNVKASNGDRVFILAADPFKVRDDDELFIRFEYRPATMDDWTDEARENATAAARKKPPKQKDLIEIAERRILATTDAALKPWIDELGRRHVKADGETAEYSSLLAYLRRYAARNTFDYFIHKDLGGFLRRELDFYIKNEVMHLDDIEHETAPRVEQYLSKIKVIRKIAAKIIDFLAQLEDFAKNLWLKKKFVTETSWIVRLDLVPEELRAEVAANEAQLEEWEELYDWRMGGLEDGKESGKRGKTKELFGDEDGLIPLAEGVAAPASITIDTRHFPADFTARLLNSFDRLEDVTDGVLFHSENFQALSLMQKRYREQVKCIYIDPPYNTGGDGFAYKDNYQHSSWLSMIANRVEAARFLLSSDGVTFTSIDDDEQAHLRMVLDRVFGADNFVANVIWQKKYAAANDAQWLSDDHDFLLCYAEDKTIWRPERLPRSAKQNKAYNNPDGDSRGPWRADNYLNNKSRDERPNLWYPIKHPKTGLDIWPRSGATWRYSQERHAVNVAEKKVWWGIEDNGTVPAYKRFLSDVGGLVPRTIWSFAEAGHNQDGVRELQALFSESPFASPKPTRLLVRTLRIAGSHTILDYFAGSGTTGHAVINLNREDGGRRKFILVEMGDYFDSVLVPRLKKVTFSPEWKDGKPKRLATEEETERSPRVMQVVRLESYEDTLNNLEPRRTQVQEQTLYGAEAGGEDGFREQYLLQYMLDVETRGSASLLNIDGFKDPASYTLKIKRPGSDETRETAIDLVGTFNWLIGLVVEHVAAPQTFSASFKRSPQGRLEIDGRLRTDQDGAYWFRRVEGRTRDGRKTLVVWRKLTDDIEQDNLVLDHYLKEKLQISTRDFEFDLIYVNGDNNLENLKQPDDTWKVRLIEEDFHRLMFDVEGV